MSLVEEVLTIYQNNRLDKKTMSKRGEALRASQIKAITKRLKKNAKRGISEVRIDSSEVYPETIDYFEEEGFIVWANSQVVVIVIPQQA